MFRSKTGNRTATCVKTLTNENKYFQNKKGPKQKVAKSAYRVVVTIMFVSSKICSREKLHEKKIRKHRFNQVGVEENSCKRN